MRRLIFLQNQNFIQTEVRLTPFKTIKKKRNKKKKKKNAAASNNESQPSPPPPHPLPPVPATSIPVATTQPTPSVQINGQLWQLDPLFLDAHHRCVLAAFLLAPQTLLSLGVGPTDSIPPVPALVDRPRSLVVGLGGGALPMALKRTLPYLRQWVAELDPDLIPVAEEYFGFRPDLTLQAIAADGVDLIHRIRTEMDVSLVC